MLVAAVSHLAALRSDPNFPRSTLLFRSRTFTFQGPTFTSQGRTFTFQGPTFTSQGRTFTSQGPTFTSQGPTFTSQGRTLTFQGPTLTFQSRPCLFKVRSSDDFPHPAWRHLGRCAGVVPHAIGHIALCNLSSSEAPLLLSASVSRRN